MATMELLAETATASERDSLLVRMLKGWIPALLSASLVLTPVMISTPAAAASNEFAQGTMEGEMDAKSNEGGPLWFFVGFCVGVLGVVIAYVVEPSPPPTRIVGKSSDYTTAYTSAYKAAGKKAQGKIALIGCVVSGLIVVLWYVFVFVVFASAATSVASTATTTY